ncbi:unnamed protein product [Ceutorhynchus assimilis]|uniref:Uncharacterized protein n=1 Tax=Ceutorhynchus assimilis TaxID=467358 RepID=A0A9P0DH77_9CUCU|nr:unnamed protein product [Ceutorhynchus assimilis]
MKRCHSTSKSELHATRPETAGKTTKTLKNSSQTPQCKDRRFSSDKMVHTNYQNVRRGTASKQQNVLPEANSSSNMLHFEEIPLEEQVKTTPKQRSKSTVSDRQPWGQLLNKHTNSENESVFGKFDPLRTLHFLARELQTNLTIRLPGETNLQEILKAMQAALKRIPPEVASLVHLQQFNILPSPSYCTSPNQNTSESKPELEEIQKLIKDGTKKLEDTCTHLETICGDLRDEKINLESKLQQEQSSLKYLQIRLEEMERSNTQSMQNLTKKEDEICQLKSSIENLEARLQISGNGNLQSQLAELKSSNSYKEQHCLKLEHKLRLCAIEKEKYLAILEVRDRQIYEIRHEMTQLQESVNEQLIELHNYALASVPAEPQVGDCSSIWLNKNEDLEGENVHKMPTRDTY